MAKRFLALWFRHLKTDWFLLRQPALKDMPFALAAPNHGRMLVTGANLIACAQGVEMGMTVADARVLVPSVTVLDDRPGLPGKLLTSLAVWCIRYTPIAAIDPPDGLVLDVSGCTHLWGGEQPYLKDIVMRLRKSGYDTRGALADTVGGAWAVARFGRLTPIIETGRQAATLLSFSPAALRLEPAILDRLNKLGLTRIGDIAGMPRSALRRRFGSGLLLRLDQAFGWVEEVIEPVQPITPYQERLPCLEPIRNAGGIEIALTRLLEILCSRLHREGKGLRTAVFKGYRVDGKLEQISIGTNRASHHVSHLYKLFHEKITEIEPDLGIELFILEAPKVEDLAPLQEALWRDGGALDDTDLAELMDRLANKIGSAGIQRFLADEHYWPERSFKPAAFLQEKTDASWSDDRSRPIRLLPRPEPIDVTAPIPDYPPMLFRYQGKLHKIRRADGPERIEQEWWIEGTRHRDYYAVEDEEGARYWLFRSGHYAGTNTSQWFLHGFFA